MNEESKKSETEKRIRLELELAVIRFMQGHADMAGKNASLERRRGQS